MKPLLKKYLGETFLGFLDYYRHHEWRKSWGGPFNNQRFRQQIFVELVEVFRFPVLFETGTFRGTTTVYLAEVSGARVCTVEALQRNYGFCLARFWNKPRGRIHASLGNSVTFLERHLPLLSPQDIPVFFYLDSHWEEHLPLLDECRLIAIAGRPAVIMIDDFEVKGDSGYQYDNFYGENCQLTLEYLAPLVGSFSVFYPTCPSEEETGAKRGCVVLGLTMEVTRKLQTISSLREYRP